MSLLRCEEPGWKLAAMNDPSGRRGIWYRVTENTFGDTVSIEICSGREGDDHYVKLDIPASGPVYDALVELVDIFGLFGSLCLMHGESVMPGGTEDKAAAIHRILGG